MMNIDEFSKYERARIIGARALQLAMGAPILLKMKKGDFESLNFSPINIAKEEFAKGILPLSIKRPMPEKVGM